MAASAADVRSILSLPPATPSTSSPFPNAGPGPSSAALALALPAGAGTGGKSRAGRKPDGITRELFALIGDSVPPLSAQLAPPRLKQKPRLGGSGEAAGDGRVKWELREFKNGARTDGLRLSHWQKATADPEQEYPFAKYSVQSTIYTYTLEEYAELLADTDWTKEETDYLFDLMRQFESRWYVVADRFDFPGGPTRKLEDIKDRYCSVCRKLLRNRPWQGDEASKTAALAMFQFDKERENMRKKYLASLSTRTPAQIAEEDALLIELKRLEQTERRFKRDRDDLLRTLLGIESGLPELAAEDDAAAAAVLGAGPGGVSADARRRRKGTLTSMAGSELESPITPGPMSIGQQVARRAQTAQSAKYDAQHCITRASPPPPSASAVAVATKSAHQPVFLRSYKLPVPKTAIAPKIALVLIELGVPVTGPGLLPAPAATPSAGGASGPSSGGATPSGVPGPEARAALTAVSGVLGIAPAGNALTPRLVMPTRGNCVRLEKLVESAAALVELKRAVDRVDQEVRVARTRLGLRAEGRGSGSASARGDGSDGEDDGEAGTPMDVDEDGEESVMGRAESVVSGRSGRGRRRAQSRRSMSISSVDTSATGARKRRK